MTHELPRTQVSNPATVSAVDGEEIFQLVKRGDIDPHEVEDASSQTIEVSVLWERAILHVAHLENGRSFVLASTTPGTAKGTTPALLGGLAAGSTLIATSAATGNYMVGAIGTAMALAGAGAGILFDQRNQEARREGSRFVVDAAVLGGASELPVVRVENGTARFVFPKGSQGEVEIDGAKRSVAQLVADGEAHAVAGSDGAFEIELRVGARCRVTLGGLTIMARFVARGRRIAAARRRDPATIWAGVGAVGAVATILAGAFIATSSDGGLASADSNADAMMELQHIMALRAERAPQEQRPQPTDNTTPAAETSGRAHRGTEGAMGRPDTSQRNHRYAIVRTGETPHMATTHARDAVAHRGIFESIGAASSALAMGGQGPVSPFGGMTEAGLDPESFRGTMSDGLPGDSFGFDGLGHAGTGIGGGGDGEDTIGTGPVGTIGRSNGDHVGEMAGHRLANRDPGGPRVRPEQPRPEGNMSPEAIRRVVLRNLGQIQHCHEQGLAQNSTLSGRVVVRFVIGGEGTVIAAGISESNLAVPAVAECIANAARRWTFSAPEGGGAVTVSYPFNLQPPQ